MQCAPGLLFVLRAGRLIDRLPVCVILDVTPATFQVDTAGPSTILRHRYTLLLCSVEIRKRLRLWGQGECPLSWPFFFTLPAVVAGSPLRPRRACAYTQRPGTGGRGTRNSCALGPG